MHHMPKATSTENHPGSCIYCEEETGEGRFELDELLESPNRYGFMHEDCENLLVLSMESKARERLNANPDDKATQALMRVFEKQADEVCGRIRNNGREKNEGGSSCPKNSSSIS